MIGNVLSDIFHQHDGVGLSVRETIVYFLKTICSCLTLDGLISRSSLDFAEEDCEIGRKLRYFKFLTLRL